MGQTHGHHKENTKRATALKKCGPAGALAGATLPRLAAQARTRTCTMCHAEFPSGNALFRHLRTVHDVSDSDVSSMSSNASDNILSAGAPGSSILRRAGRARTHTCTRCRAEFPSSRALFRHRRTVHDVFDSEEDSDCSSVSSSSGSSTLRRRSVTRTGSRITFRPPRSSGTPSRCRNRQEMRRSMLARCSKPRTCEHCGVRFPSGNALFRHLAAGCSADGGSHGDALTRSSARGSAPRASARAPAAAPSMERFIRMDEPHGLGELEGYEYRSGELGMGYYCLGAAPAAAQAAPQDTSLRTLLRSTEGRRGRSGSLFARRRAALAATTTRHSPPPAVAWSPPAPTDPKPATATPPRLPRPQPLNRSVSSARRQGVLERSRVRDNGERMVDDLKAAATSKQFVAILEAMLAMLQTLEFPTNAQQFPRGALIVVARDHLTNHPAEWSLEARKLLGKVLHTTAPRE